MPITNLNTADFQLSDDVWRSLGAYVYALKDTSGKIFYIGKGGADGEGNMRLLGHFMEAENEQNTSGKASNIRSIWAEGKPVEWIIIRHSLTSEQALEVESSLIQTLNNQGINLTNLNDGFGAVDRGIMNRERLLVFNAQAFNVPNCTGKTFLLFNISNAVARGENLDHALRYHWKISAAHPLARNNHENTYAIGLQQMISRVSINMTGWLEPVQLNPRRCPIAGDVVAGNDPIANLILHKNFSSIVNQAIGYWQQGGWIAFKVENNGVITWLRGLGGQVPPNESTAE